MTAPEPNPAIPERSKGERTAERILDAAEIVFAERGYEGASLREIARCADIQQPGLYNHFKNKEALYEAVLDRALLPMTEAMQSEVRRVGSTSFQPTLAALMTDILLEHPTMAALFQQALQGREASAGGQLIGRWLDRLFEQGVETMRSVGDPGVDRVDLVIRTIAMFNLTTGYFLSQRLFESLVGSDITDPANIARQKTLLNRIVRAALLDDDHVDAPHGLDAGGERLDRK